MARKISVMTEQIIQAAFELTRQEGFEGLTARKLAGYLGCSTQPIFRVFRSMEELYDEIYERMIKDFSDFCNSFEKTEELPFINLGLAYIAYANEQPQFFRILFLQKKRCGKGLYELLNGSEGNLVKEINKAAADGVKNPGDVFMKMWIFIHGAACMVITKDYDLDDAQTRQLLCDSYLSYAGS
ncbi:MAG: TetR/AcrR family transcriptional regulator [Lachnospiraceae bacterium]|nr:TetR/AcrR family transcriptional regulator [Lachnospiraceae bacterium]